MSPEASEAEKTEVSVEKTIFHHIDGMAIGSTVQSLAMHGVFDRLKKTHSPCNVNHLADEVGARKGYFQVALRLLAHQGFLRLSGEMDNGRKEVSLTDEGIAWFTLVDYYQQIPAIIGLCLRVTRDSSSPIYAIDSETVFTTSPQPHGNIGYYGPCGSTPPRGARRCNHDRIVYARGFWKNLFQEWDFFYRSTKLPRIQQSQNL